MKREEIGKAGRAKMEREFDKNKVVEETVNVLKQERGYEMTLTNYWWLLIWLFTGGIVLALYFSQTPRNGMRKDGNKMGHCTGGLHADGDRLPAIIVGPGIEVMRLEIRQRIESLSRMHLPLWQK
ncbi:MAG: hypothetical protein ACLUD0_17945 [Eubacterium ramulus]